MTDLINRLADGFRLPRVYFSTGSTDTGEWNELATLAITNAAQKFDLNAAAVFPHATTGKNQIKGSRQTFLTLQPLGGDIYVRARHTNDSGAAGTTAGDATNGMKVANGEKAHVEIVEPFTTLDIIGSAASFSCQIWKSNEQV